MKRQLAAVNESGERTNEAELYRLKGELLLGLNNERDAEICFEKAIDIAQQQEAKSWELRAVVSLSKLLIAQNRHEIAYKRLKPVYDWFTEGFDTSDLTEARALLHRLSE